MIAELGLFALVLSLLLSFALAVMSLVGASRGWYRWMSVGTTLSVLTFVLSMVSLFSLAYSFVQFDFSVKYVAEHSNLQLPLIYRISAIWGGHEGSLLLWVCMLTGWSAAVAVSCRRAPRDVVARVIGVLGVLSAGFIAFALFTSNPFQRLSPSPINGADLNPLLQDPGLAIHPPMLYMGYVGFAVAFAFAIAALMTGRLDGAWARWARPWTNAAWACLTLGIALGSWWAYHELGWGGWWFWDPVENASFMPWLMGTALVHSLAATDKRGVLKTWTAFLAISTFSLSLLGTFLVRSGVLSSVHAFASDPARGAVLLTYLAIVVGFAFALYAINGNKLRSFVRVELISRESALVVNNVLLAVATLTVLLGTLYPVFAETFGGGRISVGPPYFNSVFVPLTLPLLFFAGLGGYVRWKRDSVSRIASSLKAAALVTLVVATIVLVIWVKELSLTVVIGVGFAVWLVTTSLASFWARRHSLNRGFVGMSVAHLGMGVFALGVAGVSVNSAEREVALGMGDVVTVGDYTFRLDSLMTIEGVNYTAARAGVSVGSPSGSTFSLEPEKRFYQSGGNPMTESDVNITPFRDVYVSMGDQDPKAIGEGKDRWTYRVQVKALIRWIWVGAGLMAFGAALAAMDPRYRRQRRPGSSVNTGALHAAG